MESENKNLNLKSDKPQYLMTGDKLHGITLHMQNLRDKYNIKERFFRVSTFFQFEPDGNFKVNKKIEKNLHFFRQDEGNAAAIGTIRISNSYDDEKGIFWKIHAIKYIFRRLSKDQNEGTQTDFKSENTIENSPLLKIIVKRNEHNDIIVEKYDSDPSKCEFVESRVSCDRSRVEKDNLLFSTEEELMYTTKNFQKQGDNYSYEVKVVDISNVSDADREAKFVKKSAKLPSSTLNFNKMSLIFYNHIGKTILFLLSLAILGIAWYLNLVSFWICLILLAVCFVLFVALAIWDQKKKIFKKPTKIWTDFCSCLGFDRGKQKENGNIPFSKTIRNRNRD